MDEPLSTKQLGWLLDESPGMIRRMIRDGEVAGTRIAAGFRIPRDEARRLGRSKIEREAGRKVTDRELDRLIDRVIETNERHTG